MSILKGAPAYLSEANTVLAELGGFAGDLINGFATDERLDFGRTVWRVGGAAVADMWHNYIDKCSSSFRCRMSMFFSP